MARERTARITAVVVLTGALLPGACTPSSEPAARAESAWRFHDVTREAGLSAFRHETGATGGFWIPESVGSGAAFTDYDGDGHLDVVLVSGGFLDGRERDGHPALAIYRNDGTGLFRETTAEVGLDSLQAYGMGIYPADVDNDGDPDLFLTTLGRNVLLRNDGGAFVDVSSASGLASDDEWSTAAAFFDADHDGDLDLYVGNYVDWSVENDQFCSLDGVNKSYCTPKAYVGTPGRYFVNDGDGTFTDGTLPGGFGTSPGNTLGAVAFDFDRDGWTDLYVTNDLRPNLLYRNEGGGVFREIALETGAAYDERGYARAGMGVDAGVIDSTGRPTLFVGNFSREPIGVFQYAPDGMFVSRESATGLLRPSLPTLTFALFLFDANLDGHADLLAVNGHVQTDIERADPQLSYRQPVHLFVNQGDGTFRDRAPELGPPLDEPLAGRGGAFGDYDGDGDLDLLVVENGGGVHLWRNDLPQNEANFLRVDLEGSTSNREGIGARVLAYAGDRVLEQQRMGGRSYLSACEPALTFGLGAATSLDSVVVLWPSGRRSVLRDVPAGQSIHLRED